MKKSIGSAVPRRGGASLWRKATAVALSCLLIAPASGIVAFGEPAGGQESAPAATKEAAGAAGATPAAADVTGTRAADEAGTAAGAGVGDAAGTADAAGVGGDSLAAGAEASAGAAAEPPAEDALDGSEADEAADGDEPAPGDGQTLEQLGIYLGQPQDDGTWVLLDGENENAANVKATVTLPAGATKPSPDHSLFIRKINPGEGFYPTEEAVEGEAGNVNDYQCYTIRWIRRGGDGTPQEMYPLNYGLNNQSATVKIEYLKAGAQLRGPLGGRKLLIFNSNQDGSLQERVADTVGAVKTAGDAYAGFTFKTSHTGPYVFVSKTIEKGYVEQLAISSITDGSGPFDNTGSLVGGEVDVPGNDASEENKVVRSYDTIHYDLAATFAAREQTVKQQKVKAYFELTLEKSATAARFNAAVMNEFGDHYGIEYLTSSGRVIMVMDHKGDYYLPLEQGGAIVRDESGFALPDTNKPVSVNSFLSGSTSGKESYKVAEGSVAKQRFVGWLEVSADEGMGTVLSGTRSFGFSIQVRNADNGEVFTPTFKMWLEGNEDNYGPETRIEGSDELIPAQPVDANEVKADGDNAVTVSAGTNFNVQLKKNGDMSYKNWFDFATGREVAEPARTELVRLANLEENYGKSNPAEFTDDGTELSSEKQAEYANYRYGRITCYGIALQLYNDTDNNPDVNRVSKNLKGFSLPVGDITFDLNLYSEAKSGGTLVEGAEKEYTAILWDYNENVPANTSYSYDYVDPGRDRVTTPNNGLGNGGRNIYWDGEARSPYAKGAAPSNYKAYHDGCYYGGDWALVGDDGEKADSLEKLNEIANPRVVTGTGAGTTYHFAVSDYDFDFDTQHFPIRDAGNSGDVTGYDSYIRNFSAGCVQVLSVFPMVQEVSEAELFLNIGVNNLKVTTRAGQTLQAKEDDRTKINHEVNKSDNKKNDQIVLYAPGNLTKGNSFNGLHNGNSPKTTADGFLGTEYWTTSYDCSTFAGDDIWIMSYGMMSSGSDYRMRSMNLLQLFDSRALSVRDKPDVCQNWDEAYDRPGTATFLYAADPDHPKGYDTNEKGVLDYMNTVREEDLVYSESLGSDGTIMVNGESLTCVGVLMELRDCDILGGKYQYMRTPVKVNGDDETLIGKTVATVNTFRTWSYDIGKGVTWANGAWNPAADGGKGKNELKGYPAVANGIDENVQYSGELANSQKGGPSCYVKTEYEDGHQVKDTHAGGTLSGNSLLILGYKANVNIVPDKGKNDTGRVVYDQGNGETIVGYSLTGIKTDISASTGQVQVPTTTLTVKAVLDEGYTGAQRISVAGGTYSMKGFAVDADEKPVDADGNPAADGSEPTDIAISSDSSAPTKLFIRGGDGKLYLISIYAALGANSQSVSFIIKDAPVGMSLPNISFKANLAGVGALQNNAEITANAYISGSGDNRAYSTAEGNMANSFVYIVMSSGTNLSKAVDVRYIDVNGEMEYTVSYTNSASQKLNKVYFYDLAPYNGDIRGSDYTGSLILEDFNLETRGGGETAKADVFYSTVESNELYEKVRVFGGNLGADGKPTDMDAAKVDSMLEDSSGGFCSLGTVTAGKFAYSDSLQTMKEDDPDDFNALMKEVTGVYVRAEDIGQNQTVVMTFKVKTVGNKAADRYGNLANSWMADSATLPLSSNQVETEVVSRSISGVVWYDRNANGVRDDDEQLLANVVATLFKKDDASGNYKVCETDITGANIGSADNVGKGSKLTDDNGAYSFDKLSPGDYLVAFKDKSSGADGVLGGYTGLAPYQVNDKNDENTNDGVAVDVPSGYAYAIKYAADSASIKLHTVKEIQDEAITLRNFVEDVGHQDLGLVNANDLTLKKVVEGNADVDKTQLSGDVFTFDVDLTLDGKPVSGTYAYELKSPPSSSHGMIEALALFVGGLVGLGDGSATSEGTVTFDRQGRSELTLKDGDEVTIKDLPVGAKYVVTEKAASGYGVTMTGAVSVSGWTAEGTIEAKRGGEVSFVTFTNKLRDPLTFAPQVNKTVAGVIAPGAPASNEKFTFEIEPSAENGAGCLMPASTKVEAGQGETVSFGALKFYKAGVYHFAISEVDEGVSGFTYDKSSWDLKVSIAPVEDASGYETGELAIQDVTYTKTDGEGKTTVLKGETAVVPFTNTYGVSSTSAQLKVTKAFDADSADRLTEKTFVFEMKDAAANPADGYAMPTSKTATATGATDALFDAITFTKAGTYAFELREVAGADAGYAYDSTPWTATVTVADVGGKLEVASIAYEQQDAGSATSDDAATFTNAYNPTAATFAPQVSKTVTGAKETKTGFDFELSLDSADPSSGVKFDKSERRTVTVTGADAIAAGSAGAAASFGEIEFAKMGTYVFRIDEKTQSGAGWTCDDATWLLTVVVTDEDGRLAATGSYAKEGANPAQISTEAAEFANNYASSGKFALKGTKVMEGRPFANGEELVFEVTALADAPELSGLRDVALSSDGKLWTGYVTVAPEAGAANAAVDFGEVSFDETHAGNSYQYQIAEMPGGKAGVTYDTAVRIVTLRVADNGDGTLAVEPSYAVAGAETGAEGEKESDADAGGPTNTLVDGLAWKNAYATGGSLDLAVSKALVGREFAEGDEFTFVIEGSEGAPLPVQRTVTVKPTGGFLTPVSFGAITFDNDDVGHTYIYTLCEESGSLAGMTYDLAARAVTVTVADPARDGKLALDVDYGEDVAGVVFTNTYEPDDPDDPGKPDAPDEPAPAPPASGDSGEPDNPAAPSEPKRPVALSQTGDVMLWVAGALTAAAAAAAVAAALAVRARRRGLRGEEGRR